MLALASNASAQFMSASGGSYTNDVGGWRIHTYTNTGTYSFNVGATGGVVQVLVVAGGGGGGSRTGGGGGAGGLIYSNAYTVVADSNYTVTVGGGGAGASDSSQNLYGESGSNSVFGALTAYGGGRGAPSGGIGGSGGSGGGSGPDGTGGEATNSATQGNNGGSAVAGIYPIYAGGGGGGAGGAGSNCVVMTTAGDGGPGVSNKISGAWVLYAGGGGGGVFAPSSTAGKGGSGIGGNGGRTESGFAGGVGAVNTGSGGGGGGVGGKGGSGIVIVRYPIANPSVGAVGVQSVVLNVPTGSAGELQWQKSADGSTWTNVTGATDASLDVTALYTNTPWFQVHAVLGSSDAYSKRMKVTSQAIANGTILTIR